jgi:hypothetical protein
MPVDANDIFELQKTFFYISSKVPLTEEYHLSGINY